jgi:hypothetical protein
MYHYTGLNGFISILENRKLWLTSSTSMNDHQEVYWFKNLFKEKLKSLRVEKSLSAEQLVMHNTSLETLRSPIVKPYICCFSEDGDLLSQWRAYADDATGISIGFIPSELKLKDALPALNINPVENNWLHKVIYNEDEQEKLLIELIDTWIFLIKNNDNSLNFSLHMNKCLAYSYIFKNPAFSEERELRIINLPLLDNSDKWFGCNGAPKFRSSGGTIASYFDFEFSVESISEIILGPKSKVNETDMNVFLRSNGFGHVTVKHSTASYR